MSFGTASENNQQKIGANNLNQGSEFGLDTAGKAAGTGFDLLHSGMQSLQQPADYYHQILAGGSAADSALAPDINRTRMAADQTRNAAETLAPRGGGRGSILFGTPMQAGSQIQSIFNTARPAAAQGLAQIGAAQAGAGNSALGTGSSFLGNANNASRSAFDAGTTQYEQQKATGGAFGGMLTALAPLANYIPGVGPFLAPILSGAGKGLGSGE